MGRKGNCAISVAKVRGAKVNFRARSRARHQLERLAVHVHDRVEARARGVDFGDQFSAQICLIKFALRFSAQNDAILLGEDIDDV